MGKYTNAILFYNKKAGQSDFDRQMALIQNHFTQHDISLEIIGFPQSIGEMEKAISEAISKGADLFIAAGGDGTISLVSSPLVGTGKPIAILPIGTGNILAKELKIPLHLKSALNLITNKDSDLIQLDAIKLTDRYYILNLSIGVSPKVMNETQVEEKKRLGFFAYFIHLFEELLGLKLERFYLDYDQKHETVVASEILITNGRLMSIEPLEWSEDVSINDGILDIFTIRAANMIDFFSVLFSAATNRKHKNPIIKSMRFSQYCKIETQTPLMVQADGDPIGKTPVEIWIEPQALNVIVPHGYSAGLQREKRSQERI